MDELFTSSSTEIDLFGSEVSQETNEGEILAISNGPDFEQAERPEIIYVHADGSDELFTSKINNEPEFEEVTESQDRGIAERNESEYREVSDRNDREDRGITERIGSIDQRTETTTSRSDDKGEEAEILRQILAKMPELKQEDENAETSTEEPETESTTDGYLYYLGEIRQETEEISKKTEVAIKNQNLMGVTIIILVSALFASLFINQLLGRMR